MRSEAFDRARHRHRRPRALEHVPRSGRCSWSPIAAQVRPSTVARAAAPYAARSAGSRGQRPHGVPYGVGVARGHQEAGAAVVDQVERAAGGRARRRARRWPWPPGRSGRTSRTGPVCAKTSSEAKIRASSSPVAAAEEDGAGQRLGEAGRLGPSPTTTTRTPGSAADAGQQLDVLLRGEPADVADDQLAVRGELAAQRLVAAARAGSGRCPHRAATGSTRGTPCVFRSRTDALDGSEGEVGGGVHGAEPAPGGGLAGAHVGAGVAGEVGLVDGDGGHAEPGGGGHAPDAEDEGAGQVDEVGAVAAMAPRRRAGWAARPGPGGSRAAGGRGRGRRGQGAAACRRVPGERGRGDDERFVTAIDEVPGGLERAVGHAVHIGRERTRSR